jgi:DNA polymerase-3 subunit beta
MNNNSGIIRSFINLRALKAAAIACEKDKSRPYLNGVFVKTIGDTVRYVATDGHRMIILRQQKVFHPYTNEFVPEDIDGIIIPLGDIKNIKLEKNNDYAEISINGDLYSIRQNLKTIDGLLIKSTFPDYERLIPRGNLSPKSKNDIPQFNARYLADFQKAGEILCEGNEKIFARITHGRAAQPALIDFVGRLGIVEGFGVIMPVRCSIELTSAPKWLDDDHPKPKRGK